MSDKKPTVQEARVLARRWLDQRELRDRCREQIDELNETLNAADAAERSMYEAIKEAFEAPPVAGRQGQGMKRCWAGIQVVLVRRERLAIVDLGQHGPRVSYPDDADGIVRHMALDTEETA